MSAKYSYREQKCRLEQEKAQLEADIRFLQQELQVATERAAAAESGLEKTLLLQAGNDIAVGMSRLYRMQPSLRIDSSLSQTGQEISISLNFSRHWNDESPSKQLFRFFKMNADGTVVFRTSPEQLLLGDSHYQSRLLWFFMKCIDQVYTSQQTRPHVKKHNKGTISRLLIASSAKHFEAFPTVTRKKVLEAFDLIWNQCYHWEEHVDYIEHTHGRPVQWNDLWQLSDFNESS